MQLSGHLHTSVCFPRGEVPGCQSVRRMGGSSELVWTWRRTERFLLLLWMEQRWARHNTDWTSPFYLLTELFRSDFSTPEDKIGTLCRNVAQQSPSNTVPYPRREDTLMELLLISARYRFEMHFAWSSNPGLSILSEIVSCTVPQPCLHSITYGCNQQFEADGYCA